MLISGSNFYQRTSDIKKVYLSISPSVSELTPKNQLSMKFLILTAAFLATVSLVASQGQTRCTTREVRLVKRKTCAARCTANVNVCGGGSCQALPDGIRNCTCDAGFVNTWNGALCIPKCIRGCMAAGGTCDAPGVCNCPNSTQYFTNGQCVTNTLCGADCFGKICDGTSCSCAANYYELVNGTTCVPTCRK